MKIIKGGKEIVLSPEDAQKAKEAIAAGKLTVKIGNTLCWVFNTKGIKDG